MALPECVRRLLPKDSPLVEVQSVAGRWSVRGISLTPIFRNKENSIAICDADRAVTLQQYNDIPARYSIALLQEALNLASRLGINQVGISQLETNTDDVAPLVLAEDRGKIAIVVAPAIAWDETGDWGDEGGEQA